ncbi:uncharacterized protein LOC131456986 [Solea solea]|uniref:uncharacterized protein LOC131456986 n=1 Tax=Solea solea TaxID=90069 RepID=UPI00272C3939|nr:uncharacterized protein LOC131456986 [Solea solea]
MHKAAHRLSERGLRGGGGGALHSPDVLIGHKTRLRLTIGSTRRHSGSLLVAASRAIRRARASREQARIRSETVWSLSEIDQIDDGVVFVFFLKHVFARCERKAARRTRGPTLPPASDAFAHESPRSAKNTYISQINAVKVFSPAVSQQTALYAQGSRAVHHPENRQFLVSCCTKRRTMVSCSPSHPRVCDAGVCPPKTDQSGLRGFVPSAAPLPALAMEPEAVRKSCGRSGGAAAAAAAAARLRLSHTSPARSTMEHSTTKGDAQEEDL